MRREKVAPLPPIEFSEVASQRALGTSPVSKAGLRRSRPRSKQTTHQRPAIPAQALERRLAKGGVGEEETSLEFQGLAQEMGSGGALQPSPPPSASFAALGDDGTQFNPDTAGAVGPNHLMVTLSSQIRIQTREGAEVSTMALDDFWASTGNPEVYDPRLQYDPQGQRWIHVAIANFTNNPGLLVAVSQSSNPTLGWNRYFLDMDGELPIFGESPNVGFNKNWIAVQVSTFYSSNFLFAESHVFALSKTNLYQGQSAVFSKFRLPLNPYGDAIYSQVPAATYDADQETVFLVSQWNNNFAGRGYLRLHTISGPVNAPVFNAGIYGVEPYILVELPSPWELFPVAGADFLPQAGKTNKIAAGDGRIQNAVFRNGTIWATHTAFLPGIVPTRSLVQWCEMLPVTGALFQYGRIEDTTGTNCYAYPSLAVNARSDVLVGYSSFSKVQYPSASYSYKTDAHDSPSTLRKSAFLKAGQAPFYVPDGTKNRWGDWSATAVDPVNDVDLWTVQEYAALPVSGEDRWGTWWGRVAPPVDLKVALTDAPDPILAGQTIQYSITVTNRDAGESASGVRVVDTLPAASAFLSAVASQGSCTHSAGVVTCQLGQLATNGQATVTITVVTTDSGTLVNSVTASANGQDMNPADNTATTSTTVNPAADMTLGITAATPNPVTVGDNLTYSIMVTNRGPSPATNAKLTNAVPANTAFVSASASQGSCSLNGSQVVCSFGTLPSQGTVSVTVVIRPTAGGTIANAFLVGSSVTEPAPGNNTASIQTRANSPPQIQTLSNRTISEDTSTGPIAFTVSDAETPATSLTVTARSSSQNLVPDASLQLGGTGTDRTITITPLPDKFGSAVITRTVTDSDGVSVSSAFTLSVSAVNDPPTITSISNQTINEDTSTATLPFVIGDVETGATNLVVGKSSSNTALVPDTRIFLGGSGSNRTVSITPLTNQFGTANITLTVSDGGLTNARTFLLTVNSVNDLPTITDIPNQTVAEDTATATLNFTVTDVETSTTNLVLSRASSSTTLIPLNNIVFGGTGSNRNVTVTPASNQVGTATITVAVADSDSGTRQDTFTVTVNPVNDPPTINPVSNMVTNEDSGPVTVALSGITAGPSNESQSLQVTALSSLPALIPHPTVNYTTPQTSGSLVFTSATNASGSATITVTVNDGAASNNLTTSTFTVTLNPVNDPPTLSAIASQTIDEDGTTGPLAFTVGDVESAPDSLSLSRSSSDTNLIPVANIVLGGTGPSRTINITPAPNAYGTATVTVTASDGTDSTSRQIPITVNPVNDPPTLSSVSDQATREDTPAQPITITITDPDTPLNSLNLRAGSSNSTLVPTNNITFTGTDSNRTVQINPAPNQFGSSTITLTVADQQLAEASRTFVLTVAAVNDPPTLNPVSNVTMDEDSGSRTVPVTGIGPGAANETQDLLVSATSSNPAILPHPNVSYTSPNASGSLTLQPATNANGVVTVTVSVDDRAASNNIVTQTFTVTISPVNDPPTISSISSKSTDEDTPTSAISFVIGDVETPADNLSLAGSSSNEEVVFSDDIIFSLTGSNRTVVVRPLPEQSGSSTITISVTDGNGATVSTEFQLTVNSVNDQPSITTVSQLALNEDTFSAPITVTISDKETPARDLVLTTQSSNPTLAPTNNLILGGTGTSRTLTVRPLTNAFGTATLTLLVSDGSTNNSSTLSLTVAAVNDPPTLNPLNDLTLYVSPEPYPVSVTGIGTGAPNEVQILNLSAQSSNPGQIPHPDVSYLSPNSTGTLAVTRTSAGTANITVTVQDDGGTAQGGQSSSNRTFAVLVKELPRLQIRLDGSQVVITWPASATGFVLEYRERVESGAWVPVEDEPVQNGDTLTVTLPAVGVQKYFQLRSP